MYFNSFEFAVFFAIVVLLHWTIAGSQRARTGLLLLASYYFYSCWSWKFCGLIAFSTLLDFVAGRRIHQSADNRVRRAWLGLSLVGNLGCLGFFKYHNFFVDSASELLSRLGLGPSLHTLEIVLPVGISFYTFQTLSYTIDIYRRELEPVERLGDFALFVAFFPQLVAGPIVRAREFLPQLARPAILDDRRSLDGVALILLGLFKKICIADLIAGALVDPAFAAPERFSGVTLLLAMYGYAMQIYCDFSGYSDIAIGAARILGFELPLNFNRPYRAASITDFWRRWHLSLSSWLRDYLYVALGGNRRGRLRTYANLLVTMLLGGLWHGAAWRFVLWGGLHGVALAIERAIHGRRRGLLPGSKIGRALAHLLTFHVVCLGWVLFRAPSADVAFTVVGRIATLSSGVTWLSPTFVVPLLVGYAMHLTPPDLKRRLRDGFLDLPLLAQAAAVTSTLVLCLVLATDDAPFIYFQF